MIMARRFICVAIGFSLLVASACGGGGDELEKALQSLSEDDLAIMVLPQEAFGDASDGLEVASYSGVNDSSEVADDTLDPEDTGDDLEEAGFVTGYSLDFEDPSFSALEEAAGILIVSSTVELFEDEQAASSYLAKLLEDNRRFEGEEVEPGTTLEEVEEFVVEGIADDATGLVLHGSFGETDFYATGVIFTVGRLRAGVGITKADDSDVTPDAERIGRAFAERIEGVLLGDIDETPVPIPEEEEERTIPCPSGIDDVAAMALSLEDLPSGVTIEREGCLSDEDTVAAYEREFDLGFAELGNSQPLFLQSAIALHEDRFSAEAFFTGMRLTFTSESGADFFARFLEDVDFEVADIQVEEIPVTGLGDGSFAGRLSADSPLGRLDVLLLAVWVDDAVGTVTLTAPAERLFVDDAVALLESMAARMEAELTTAR